MEILLDKKTDAGRGQETGIWSGQNPEQNHLTRKKLATWHIYTSAL